MTTPQPRRHSAPSSPKRTDLRFPTHALKRPNTLRAPSSMLMQLPLVSWLSTHDILAWRDGHAVTVRDFLHDVQCLASRLPANGHVLNVCKDRYRFLVGFGASATAGKISLLPSTRTPEAIRQLRSLAPDAFCLSDHDDGIDLPRVTYAEHNVGCEATAVVTMPRIDADRVVAQVFTSGSTGAPVPHAKRWGSLVDCVQAGALRLALHDGRCHALVSTVPPQHMYGFESTALIALHGGVAMSAEQPFYPADVAAALTRIPAPRMLVTSPVHLRALLASRVRIPPLNLILSATAPLARDLAQTAETCLNAPLVEIYGSTETGQIATRRTAHTDVWELFSGVRLEPEMYGHVRVTGGHLTQAQVLHDVIEIVDDRRFLMHGRGADMINIAGKRSSLAYLNHQLTSIPGVRDGAFFMPEANAGDSVARLMAFVVAPAIDPALVRDALRERLDPAFMPRPLLFVDALPRNATGKLPRAALSALAKHAAAPQLIDDNHHAP